MARLNNDAPTMSIRDALEYIGHAEAADRAADDMAMVAAIAIGNATIASGKQLAIADLCDRIDAARANKNRAAEKRFYRIAELVHFGVFAASTRKSEKSKATRKLGSHDICDQCFMINGLPSDRAARTNTRRAMAANWQEFRAAIVDLWHVEGIRCSYIQHARSATERGQDLADALRKYCEAQEIEVLDFCRIFGLIQEADENMENAAETVETA